MKPKIFRAQKLVKRGLQLKLIATFGFLACVAALLQFILLNHALMDVSERLENDSSALLAHMPTLFLSNLVLTLALLLPAMFFVGVLVTHRIAGPVWRFEAHLAAIARGEDPGECVIRRRDELQGLCDGINAAVHRLRSENAPAATGPRRLSDAA